MLRRLPMLVAVFSVVLAAFTAQAKDRVLFVDAYHEGYAWSDGLVEGAKKALGDRVDLKIVHMDTKRNGSEEFKKEAGEKVGQLIDEWKPNVVIACDDNGAKYVIKRFENEKDIPFVFCGVNWDASMYDFSKDKVCGMLEVSLIPQLLGELKQLGKTEKIGFLGPDIETSHKEAEGIEKRFNLDLNTVFSKNYDEWKEGFKNLQGQCDVVLIDSDGALYTAEHAAEMKQFVRDNTKTTTASNYDFMAPYAMLTYAKLAQEQGEWAGNAALRLLKGEKPSDIGVVENKEGQIYLNLDIAKKTGVDVPMELIETATIVVD